MPVEISEPSWWVMYTSPHNKNLLKEDLDLIIETCEMARVMEMSQKHRIAQRYNMKIEKHEFAVNDIVMRRASVCQKKATHEKLAAN
jgi:hypothetical protein